MSSPINQLLLPPLSLYIHIPWCVRKCPYCDFNSHATQGGEDIPEASYIKALLGDHIIEEIGCKFRLEPSSFCKFKNCDNSLCQFQHKNDHEAEEASLKEVDDRYIEVEVDSSTKCNECDQQCYTLKT